MAFADTLRVIHSSIDKQKNNNVLAGHSITLLAASKGQSVAVIEAAIVAGITDLGENRVQEAESKWPQIKERHPRVRLHLIGPLQTNKAAQAVELFDVIQTIDRPKLADALAVAMTRAGKQLSCFIQVNTGTEPQKAGVIPSEADALITYCQTLSLPLVGLMCIPPDGLPPAPHFALLRSIAMSHGLNELSMGMSGDYQEAVRMGSSCVRLGRILFGERS